MLHAANVRKNSCAAILSSPTKSLCNSLASSESIVISDLLSLCLVNGPETYSMDKLR